MKTILASSLLAAIASALPAFAGASDKLPSDNYEQPRHQVIERVENIEIRRYEPMLLAEVDVEGDRGTAANRAFRILAGYIFGGNVSRTSIAMTSPVTQAEAPPQSEKIAMTSPVTQVALAPNAAASEPGSGRWTVAFMMPSGYTLDTLPKARDNRIRFRMTEPVTRAAIRFAGMSTEGNLSEHREKLAQFVKARNMSTVGEPTVAYYDDPFTLPWRRRNEWWVQIAN
jgi:hypothetical protein